ncbi:MAG: transglutaminase domain-containing protein [Candidatus Marinimicrobia bacterium]|nr:transglutaminase domain-containing protein [Candidatus Neomarinimicrobiota bacterium]
MKNSAVFFIIGIISILIFQCSGKSEENLIRKNIIAGNYEIAQRLLLDLIIANQDSIDQDYIDSIKFEIERLDRIKLDFNLDSSQVLEKVRKYVPSAKDSSLRLWTQQNYLESKIIEGKVKYFNHAVENLFRVHPELRMIKTKADSITTDQRKIRKYVSFPLAMHINRVLSDGKKYKKKYLLPVTMHVTHTIEIEPNLLPKDEIVKCWIPYPLEIEKQQYNIQRITSNPHVHVIADNNNLQRTIFMQAIAKPDTGITFMVKYEFTSTAIYNNIEADKVKVLSDTTEFSNYLKERPPHIVFPEPLIELSHRIVGNEKNPYLVAKKIFTWIDENIDWTLCREYSTIRSLALYPFFYKQGDAGVKTFLFMSLCRYNKIPARLVSGWQFQPPLKSLHDWCEIYLDPYGWVPVDVTYGMQNFPDDERRYFYLGNIDSYRLVFNRDYGTPFTPPKEFFRSDMIDNQRGELETASGNLYFDKWKWNMDFEIKSTYK